MQYPNVDDKPKTVQAYKNMLSLFTTEHDPTEQSPFFIRPFPIKESDKDIVDKEMRKGCLLGILKKGMSSYSSPIMLIPRKLFGIPRTVVQENSRLWHGKL